jgi:hypothetical protein
MIEARVITNETSYWAMSHFSARLVVGKEMAESHF